MIYDKIIVGGGIVGLAIALAIKTRDPDCKMAVIEKEMDWALHQSSRNSGVIHAGVYFKPGSKKARFAQAGNASMIDFCEKHGIPHERCGKLIIATSKEQIPGLEAIYNRATASGLDVSKISGWAAREIEPHINCVKAMQVPSTAIVDFKLVAEKYVELLGESGVDLILECKIEGVKEHDWGYTLSSSQLVYQTKYLISAVGLYADRMANRSGINPEMMIIPFRGEYWRLKESKRSLVKNLIYPVPNPKFPFLGVHMTRHIDGSVSAGPNAVLAFSREGYGWGNVNAKDLFEILSYPGMWNLANSFLKEGLKEMYRSLMKSAFLASIQELVPEIDSSDLVRGEAGVRAQAIRADGSLLDDFYLLEKKNAVFVLNAPSPAATASLEIGKYIADKIYASVW